ncbi:MAG: reverse transcriptase family protein [Candidatus Thiodiazotropha sp.]
METVGRANVKSSKDSSSYLKFVRTYPPDFLSSRIDELNTCIDRIESDISTQEGLDDIYKEVVSLIKDEMLDKVQHKEIKIFSGTDNKPRRIKKPWWNDHLTELWNTMCAAEKRMLTCRTADRRRCRSEYTQMRKNFNRECQKAKRLDLKSKQNELENLVTENNQQFWKEIGKIGIGKERRKVIPMEVISSDGSINGDKSVVLETWKDSFSRLLNPSSSTEQQNVDVQDAFNRTDINVNHSYLNRSITLTEIKSALLRLKDNKAEGLDGIPSEVWKNENLLTTLHSLFNHCFHTAKIPELWKCGIINPVIKSSTNDLRDPLSYRGITITPSIYKLYCNVLNNRLMKWESENSIIHDSQNGFRKGRSTIDQVLSLTSIVDTRKLKKQSTFAAFIDFSKAYDSIDRQILFQKLEYLGLHGNIYNAIKSLYDEVKCCVRINGIKTAFFEVRCGLKQGCTLSTILFNLYVNDLVTRINSLNVGIDIGGEKVAVLLYADDLVLLAPTEHDLQTLLDELDNWCNQNKLLINQQKSNIVHFRPTRVVKSNYTFNCGDKILEIVPQYIYLGLLLSEHLDYEKMAKNVCKAANRALGLVIAKCKTFGGFDFGTFSKLYDSMVWSVINYGAAIWGNRPFSCINNIHLRAQRYYMGVGKYTPNAAVQGDMGWEPAVVRQWSSVLNQWIRSKSMNSNRLNYRIFEWCEQHASQRCKNWNFRVNTMLRESGVLLITNYRLIKNRVKEFVFDKFKSDWLHDINRENARYGNGRNKLRTYRQYKQEFQSETYLKCSMSRAHRSAYAKFRCGVAPIRIETGRYERLNYNDRTCFYCIDKVENEEHVLLDCPQYASLRESLFVNLSAEFPNIMSFSNVEKLSAIFSCQSFQSIRYCAKICHNILRMRRNMLYH